MESKLSFTSAQCDKKSIHTRPTAGHESPLKGVYIGLYIFPQAGQIAGSIILLII